MQSLWGGRRGARQASERDYLVWRPLLNAALIAAVYGLLGIAYIHVSDGIAAALAPDKATLSRIQELKGTAFMVASATLLFAFTFPLFRRVYRGALTSLRAHQALLDAERKASAAVVSLCVAHDLSNQLQVLRSITYLLGTRCGALEPKAGELLRSMDEAVDKLDTMLGEMRAGGRRSAVTDLAAVDLADFVEESLRYLRHHDRVRHCRLTVVAQARPRMTVCPGVLHDALLNLVLNAGDALEGNGEIRVDILPSNGHTAIEVHDSGAGIPPAMQATLFQPFRTTKANGTGLGLLAVQACAELHGGQVAYQPSPLGGACFRMTLQSIERPATP